MKRTFILVAAFTVVFAMLITGCASPGDTSSTTVSDSGTTAPAETTDDSGTAPADGPVNPAGQMPITNEIIELTLYKEGAPTEDYLATLSENGVLRYIEDLTNIRLSFEFLSAQEGKQRMILAFAGGDYPDGGLLDWNTLMTQSDVMQYGVKEGILAPLNDLIDNYGHEINILFEMRPNHRAYITAPDGEIYGLPRMSECGHCMSYPKLWMNYEWLEVLGLEEPTTTDELYEVLKAFKTRDPNGNGLDDEIALTGGIEYSMAAEYWLLNSFIDVPASSHSTNPRPFLSWINDQVTFVADKPEYKEGLEYIKMLYDEGLLDPANFTQGTEGLAQQSRTEIPTVGAYTTDHMTMGVNYFGDKEIAMQYQALPPVAGPNGVRYQSYTDPVNQLPGFQFVIFDTCENKEALFRLADYFLSEDYLPIGHYGIEGINWERPADPDAKNILGEQLKWVPIRLPEGTPQEELDEQALNNFWTPLLGDTIERRAMWSPAATPESLRENYETYLEYETQKTVEYWPDVVLPRNLFMEQELAEEFTELKLNISSHVIQNTSLFITGARSLDEWDTYISELQRFGLDRYMEIYTEAYEGYIANLR